MNLELDPKLTALVLIDLQHGILARQLTPHTSAEVVERGARLAEAVRGAGGTVVYVRVLLNETLRLPADSPQPRPPGTPGPEASELVPEAGFQAGDVLISKRQWDAFYATELDQQLRRRHIRTVIMGGVATNFGVESTARSAQARGYELVFAEDAISTTNADMHRFAVETMFPIMGRVRSVEAIAAALGGA